MHANEIYIFVATAVSQLFLRGVYAVNVPVICLVLQTIQMLFSLADQMMPRLSSS